MTDNATDKTGESKKEGVREPNPTPLEQSVDIADVPDPDEDDLDDLDGTFTPLWLSQPCLTNCPSDMLEDFSALKTEPKRPDVPSGPGRPTDAAGPAEKQPSSEEPTLEEVLSDDEFAKRLQDGMAEMLGGIENSPEMKEEFEKIFRDIAAAAGTDDDLPIPSAQTAASTSASTAIPTFGNPKEPDFQETIRRTMERMAASGEQATAAATEAGSDDFLNDLLKTMSQAGGADGSEEEFSKLLMGMMEQLTNKDILYEPMKELNDKFPEWMEKNKDKVSAEELKRYEEQQALAKEIVAKFEEPTFSDANAKDREYIVDRMQKVRR